MSHYIFVTHLEKNWRQKIEIENGKKKKKQKILQSHPSCLSSQSVKKTFAKP